MQKAVIHTNTRIITKLTRDINHPLDASESMVNVPDNFDIANGPWKLDVDNVSKIRPTNNEINNAKDDFFPVRVTQRNLRQKMQALINDATVPQSVKDFVIALRNYYQDID